MFTVRTPNEQLIHDALHPYPGRLAVATKGGFVRGSREFTSIQAIGAANYLRQAARLSARRLGVECIDLYYLHSGRATDASFEDQIATLAGLRDEGVIRHIGLSNVTAEQFEVARGITDIAAVTARRHHVTDRTRLAAALLAGRGCDSGNNEHRASASESRRPRRPARAG